MDKIKIPMAGGFDRRNKPYYFTTTRVPVSLDLTRSVILVFPSETEDGKPKAELVFRKYDGPNRFSNDADDVISPTTPDDDDSDGV